MCIHVHGCVYMRARVCVCVCVYARVCVFVHDWIYYGVQEYKRGLGACPLGKN